MLSCRINMFCYIKRNGLWYLIQFPFIKISQAGNGKVGESASSPFLRDVDAEVAGDECFSTEVPDTCWAVPQIPSSPTASGLNWPTKSIQNPFDAALLESDASYFPLQNIQDQQSNGSGTKRSRRFQHILLKFRKLGSE